MNLHRLIDVTGTISKIGLLLCFVGAVWMEAVGDRQLKPFVMNCTAVFITMLAATLAVYVWEIVRKRKQRSGSR